MTSATDGPAELSLSDAIADPARANIRRTFGIDLDAVRVKRDDPQVAALGARAVTGNSTIAFAPGQFAPHTEPGVRLLAHEAAHVRQQEIAPSLEPAGVDAVAEADAWSGADAVMNGRTAPSATGRAMPAHQAAPPAVEPWWVKAQQQLPADERAEFITALKQHVASEPDVGEVVKGRKLGALKPGTSPQDLWSPEERARVDEILTRWRSEGPPEAEKAFIEKALERRRLQGAEKLGSLNAPAELRQLVIESEVEFGTAKMKLSDLAYENPDKLQELFTYWKERAAKPGKAALTFEEYLAKRNFEYKGLQGETRLAFVLGPRQIMVAAPEGVTEPGIDLVTFDGEWIHLRDNKAIAAGKKQGEVSALEENLPKNLEDVIEVVEAYTKTPGAPPEIKAVVLPKLRQAAKAVAALYKNMPEQGVKDPKFAAEVTSALAKAGVRRTVDFEGAGPGAGASKGLVARGVDEGEKAPPKPGKKGPSTSGKSTKTPPSKGKSVAPTKPGPAAPSTPKGSATEAPAAVPNEGTQGVVSAPQPAGQSSEPIKAAPSEPAAPVAVKAPPPPPVPSPEPAGPAVVKAPTPAPVPSPEPAAPAAVKAPPPPPVPSPGSAAEPAQKWDPETSMTVAIPPKASVKAAPKLPAPAAPKPPVTDAPKPSGTTAPETSGSPAPKTSAIPEPKAGADAAPEIPVALASPLAGKPAPPNLETSATGSSGAVGKATEERPAGMTMSKETLESFAMPPPSERIDPPLGERLARAAKSPEGANALTVLADLQARYLERKEFTEDWNKFWHATWEGVSVRIVDGSPSGDLFYAGTDFAPTLGVRGGLGDPVDGLLFFNRAAARELASRSDVDRRRLTATLAQLQYRGWDTGARGAGEDPYRSRLTVDRRGPLSDDDFVKLLTEIGLAPQSE